MKRMNLRTWFAGAAMTLAVFASCSKDDNPQPNMYTISGAGNGSQVVPSVNGQGTGNISGTYDASTGVMNYTTTWNNMSGAPNSGGFYTGAAGSSGVAMGSPWTWAPGITGNGSASGSVTLNAEQASQLRNGNLYYSMGTAANPNGEVRGQMSAVPQ